jgi:hypothetical protein
MENIDPTTNPISDIQSNETKESIGKVFKFILYNLIIYLLKLPYVLFKKSTSRLSDMSEKGSLSVEKSTSKWPFLSWIKTYILDFGFDASTFLCYVVGFPLIGLSLVMDIFDLNEYYTFGDAVGAHIGLLIGCYFIPLSIAFARDIFQILILPFRKYIDWAKKPAQHQDITHTGSIRNN